MSAVSLGQYPPTKRYTSTTDFQEGQFDNVHDSGDRLEITPPDALHPYVNVACSGINRETVVRIYVGSGDSVLLQSELERSVV
ncbi:MAG: hypothetical protein ACPMAQ_17770 [Phycisphaerae bacterium]